MSSEKKEGIEPESNRPPSSIEAIGLAASWQAAAERGGVDPLIGTTIGGRYHIQSVLGKGGMSIVYQASQAPVDRIVAVKTLKFQMMGDPVLVKRFEREVKTLSKLNHPNIVTVFDCVLDGRGQPYFVMDCLSGRSLQEILKEDVLLDPSRCQHIFVQVSSAVEHAHRHGIIHRDIKPGNIMIQQTGGNDFVKVVDFGLARLMEDAQRLTQSGEIWGSPLYMSPEQSSAEDLDARSDIYSLGTVMYEALCGAPPFRGKTFIETMSLQVNAPTPSFKEVAPLVNVPQPFEQVVRKCLEKDPNARYQTMAELKEALKTAIPGRQYEGMQAVSATGAPKGRPPAPLPKIKKQPATGFNYKSKGLSPKIVYAPLVGIIVIAASAVAFRGLVWHSPPAGGTVSAPPAQAPSVPRSASAPAPLTPFRTPAVPPLQRPPTSAPKKNEKQTAHLEHSAQVIHQKKRPAKVQREAAVVLAKPQTKTAGKAAPAKAAAHPNDEFARLRATESDAYKRDKEQP